MRYAGSMVAGIAITLLLFFLMQILIGSNQGSNRSEDDGAVLDFIRLKQDEIVNLKQRVRPKKPPPPEKPPPPPKLRLANQQAPPRALPQIEIPNISLPSSAGGGPFLGKWSAGDPASDGDMIPMFRIEPQYPREALRNGIEGYVRVELTVLPDGSVKDVKVLESEPRRLFNLSAIRAVLKWKFKPTIVEGQAVESRATTRVDYKMEKR